MNSIEIPPIIANTNDTMKIAEKPNTEITQAAIIGARACVIVLPKL